MELAETSSAVWLQGGEVKSSLSTNNQFMCYAERFFRIATLIPSGCLLALLYVTTIIIVAADYMQLHTMPFHATLRTLNKAASWLRNIRYSEVFNGIRHLLLPFSFYRAAPLVVGKTYMCVAIVEPCRFNISSVEVIYQN